MSKQKIYSPELAPLEAEVRALQGRGNYTLDEFRVVLRPYLVKLWTTAKTFRDVRTEEEANAKFDWLYGSEKNVDRNRIMRKEEPYGHDQAHKDRNTRS